MTRRLIPIAALLVLPGAWLLFSAPTADRYVAPPAVADTVIVLVGEFQAVAREGRGTVQILDLANGQMVARVSGLATGRGSDVRLYLLGAASVRNAAELERVGFVDLGPLRLTGRDEIYVIPPNTPLTRVRAIAVWDRDGNLNFTTAELRPPR